MSGEYVQGECTRPQRERQHSSAESFVGLTDGRSVSQHVCVSVGN